ncbi:MAG TPA: transglycosylase SLT domain-containing protein [Mycobacteriales bacterium]|nr:transglycosylase SLT domain-containing protein [Mycobacteriales bacterium]
MAGREKAAAEIADDLETLGRELRAEFNRAVRTIAPVTFSGPVAQQFDRRLRAHLAELNAILATMGVATDDLRIIGRSDGELSLRRRSTGYREDPGNPGTHTRPSAAPAELPSQYRHLLPLVQRSATRQHVSPALLLAIMDRETGDPHRIGFGARNPAVTNGNDFGLMQINRAAHPDFFAHHDWRDPAANIDYGAGVIAADLRHYDGNAARAAAAYNAGPGNVDRALAAGHSADSVTAGGDYGSDVARRYEYFSRVLADGKG